MEARVAKCLLLSKVLAADGIMTENERFFLDKEMKRLGITPEERRGILDLEGWDDAEAALKALPEEEKRELMSQLVDAASADGRLSPLEMAMVKSISAALGIV
ncbi:MAG: TerB family tellurite resistance protein [Deltaproteobacteria bacterium]|nr:TerB family tellurite resistance protein [Deltaproteobacteria bacterium]